MQKKFLFLLFGVLFLLADFFGSLFVFSGKTPVQVLGLSGPKISITPFPTLIAEQETKNQSNFSASGTTKTNSINFPYQQVKAGDTVTIACNYNQNPSDLKITKEVNFISHGDLNGRPEGDQKTFAIFKEEDQMNSGSGKVSATFSIPNNMPNGSFRAILSMYVDNYNVIGRCNSGLFTLNNADPGILVLGLEQESTTSSLIPALSQTDKKISFNIYSAKDLVDIKPKLEIINPLKREEKVFAKENNIISILKNTFSPYQFDISGFSQTGLFLVKVIFSDSKGNIVSLAPLLPVIFGARPSISDVKAIAKDQNYKLSVSYANDNMFQDPSYELIAGVCDKESCSYEKENISSGWPKEIIITKVKNTAVKKTISIDIVAKGLSGYINSYLKN